MTQMDMSSEILRQADLVPLARAIKNSKFDVAKAEFARIDAYEKQIEIGKAFCIDMLEDMLKLRVNLCYVLLFAALLRRHRRAGDFNVLDHFLTRARETVDQYDSFPQFFQMQLMFAAKRRDKTFFLYDTLSQGTYQHELANTQLCRDRIGTAPAPTRSPDAPIRTVVFCASFLPESYNIKHAELIIRNMVFLANLDPNLRCVLVLTSETVFHTELFAHFTQESDNLSTIATRIRHENKRHGLSLELIAIDGTKPHHTRVTQAIEEISNLAPDAMFFAGGYCKCESFYVAHHFGDVVPEVFIATSASNTVGPQYAAVFAKDENNPLTGAEGKIWVVPSAAFEDFDLSLDDQGDDFFHTIKDKTVIFSALSNLRVYDALKACKESFFEELDAFFDRNPNVVWPIVGVRNIADVQAIHPVMAEHAAKGRIVVKGLIENFGHYLSHARVFVSLPNSIGGGFSGFSASSLGVPSVYCRKSDLPGMFHLPDLCFEDTDYKGFFSKIEQLIQDDDAHADACKRLAEIRAAFSLESVGRKRFDALETVVADFRAKADMIGTAD